MYFRYIYTKECCVKQVTFESLSLLYKDFYFSDVKHIIIGIWEFMGLKVNKMFFFYIKVFNKVSSIFFEWQI